jgi:phosphomannomutase
MEAVIRKSGGLVVGYEANGGFLLGGDLVTERGQLLALATRDAVLPILCMLCAMQKRNCKLSELAQQLPARFTASDRLQQFPTELSQTLLVRLQADRREAERILAPDSGGIINTDLTDGLRHTFANGDIVHLRPSGNAPELRCYAEAGSAIRAQQLCSQCLQRLSSL